MPRITAASAMALPSDLHGRWAVVTGAAAGIGRAIALRLAQAGARVLVVDNDKQRLENGLGRAEWNGLEVIPVAADLGDVDPVAFAESLLGRGSPIELIVNNVGICTGTGFLETGQGQFDQVMRTNLGNPWFFTKRLVEELIHRKRRGSVLFISSLHERFISRRPQYSMSKAGVSMGARELAAALAQFGIRVNAISPGWIDTQSEKRTHPERRRAKARRMTALIPLSRPGHPDDVAKLAVFLLSDELAGYITGANIPVDGGLSLHSWVRGDEPTS